MTHRPRRLLKLVIVFAGIALPSSCAIPDDDDTSAFVHEDATVAAARKELIGLSEAEIRMCAGFPSATADVGGAGKIWTYRQTLPRGTLNVAVPTVAVGPLPGLGGSVNVSSGGYCHTQVRLVDSQVAEVAFAGDNNTTRSINALCASMIDECVIYARNRRSSDRQR